MSELKYEEVGEMSLEEANDMNVPINIFIGESSEMSDEYEDKWELSASNFMPRKQVVADSQYRVVADDKETLVALVNKYIVPLYETAITQLKTNGELYYWNLNND